MEKRPTPATTAGLIIGLILVVITLVLYFTGLYTATWTQYIGFIILFGGIIWSVVNHGKETDHRAGFGSLFGYGFKTTAVITCILIAYTVLSGFIFPDIKEQVIETAREQALKQPGATEEAINQGMDMFANNYTLFIILGLLFWNLFGGAIASLIGAAVTKKRPAEPTFENN